MISLCGRMFGSTHVLVMLIIFNQNAIHTVKDYEMTNVSETKHILSLLQMLGSQSHLFLQN